MRRPGRRLDRLRQRGARDSRPAGGGALHQRPEHAGGRQRADQAAKLFDEVERQHPYSSWATQALLMAAYSYYLMDDYDNAIPALENFIELHPGNRNVAYAYYLRALCYYEQIADVTRDQGNTEEAHARAERRDRALSQHALRPRRQPEARPGARPPGRQGDGGRPLLPDSATCTWRRSTASAPWSSSTRPPPTCRRRCIAWSRPICRSASTTRRRRPAAVLGYNYPGSDWYQDSYDLLAARDLQPTGPRRRGPGCKAPSDGGPAAACSRRSPSAMSS